MSRPMLPGNRELRDVDPDMYDLIQDERARQLNGIELIASENFTSAAVMEALGSCLTNKYSEGQPGARYYGGNEVIDKVENLCKDRALAAFGLKPSEWGVNVQPYSGSPANFAVYTALLPPHSRVMGLDLPSGGHLTHGYYTAKKKISATSIYFESLPYKVNPQTGYIDFEGLRQTALLYRPAMILCGASAYPREVDFAKFKSIADECGAILMADIAHISGLVASGLHGSPFEHCDIVTTTTHKSLRGPRSGMIFFKMNGKFPDIKERIDMAVFPALQGGPHNHQIGALAVQLKEVASQEFKKYSGEIISNAKALAQEMMARGHKLATDGTDNHLILWDVRPHGLTGSKIEKVCDLAAITVNRNAVHGDVSALSPGGVRVGTPAMTTRGCTEDDFKMIASFLDEACKITLEIQSERGKKLKDFELGLVGNAKIAALKEKVEGWVAKFGYPEPMPKKAGEPKTVLLATEKPFTADAVCKMQKIMDRWGYTFKKLENYKDKAQLLEAVKDVDAMVIRSDLVTPEVLDAAKEKLKLVVRAGAGVDNIDLPAASQRNVTCMNTPGANANAVAELAFGMMIQNCRNNYDGSSGYELRGKTLALYGYGAVARCIHTIAKGFDMIVSAYDPFLSKEQIEAGGAKYLDKVEALFESQFVSLHVPSTPQTNNSINFNLLSKMPKNAVLINTARPEVVDEAGLKKLLTERSDFCYLTDVPPKTLADLQTVPDGEKRVFCTKKKMGAQTSEANNNAGIQACNQIVGFFERGDRRGEVKP